MVDFDKLFDKKLFEKEIEATHKSEVKLGLSNYTDAVILPCKELANGKSGGVL